MSKPDYIVEAKGLSKSYRNRAAIVEVLRGIDLKVQRGEIIVIMGPSGVGKSTLLNLLGTLDSPTTGTVLIDGKDVFAFKEQELASFRNQHISFIFQFHHLMNEFDAIENVLMPRMIRGRGWNEDRDRAVQLLTDVGLGERLTHKPNQLSGGEQQRVAIARSLMNSPELILADEPTGDLDRGNSRALFELIIELNEKYQQSYIIVTHDEMFVERAHRIIHLAEGRIDSEQILRTV